MKKIFGLCLCLALNFCATQVAYISLEHDRPGMVPAYEKRHHFVLFGVGQTKEISASQICDSRPVAKIESSFTFVDILLSMLTWGIYTPRTIEVYCDQSPKK
ncbi:hypothetical protein AYB34_08475 [Leptospira sp. ZV016]|nr:hypothetical protein AYB32_14910 [Leptospira kirschneri]KXZ34264.1 hypothetical protein AYB34_08475 [Leptospira sp. ZV016]